MLPFHLMIKPAGARCNLACEYCYYIEKSALYPESACRMDDATLERITAAYLNSHPSPEVTFAWQGGEPLLMGIDFYRKAIELQRKYVLPGQTAVNALQTNATLIDDEWAAFFAENNFLIGVSIDGPPDVHNRYRRDKRGKNTHAAVLKGLECLRQHGVEHNALVTVNRANARYPLKVYNYLIGLGLDFLQFIPIVELISQDRPEVTEWSVRPEHYGEFLCAIFDEWVRRDVGSVFIQQFESALNGVMTGVPSVCVFAQTCGRALVVEHNGDLYACDHFVYDQYRRGTVGIDTLESLIDGPEQEAFGLAKVDLSSRCLGCEVLSLCGGDCPKHRICTAEDGKPVSYLCPAYRKFFTYGRPLLDAMAYELHSGRSAMNIVK